MAIGLSALAWLLLELKSGDAHENQPMDSQTSERSREASANESDIYSPAMVSGTNDSNAERRHAAQSIEEEDAITEPSKPNIDSIEAELRSIPLSDWGSEEYVKSLALTVGKRPTSRMRFDELRIFGPAGDETLRERSSALARESQERGAPEQDFDRAVEVVADLLEEAQALYAEAATGGRDIAFERVLAGSFTTADPLDPIPNLYKTSEVLAYGFVGLQGDGARRIVAVYTHEEPNLSGIGDRIKSLAVVWEESLRGELGL